MARPGDRCPCGHYLTVLDSKVRAGYRVRYIGCKNCGHRPDDNKIIAPLQTSIGQTS